MHRIGGSTLAALIAALTLVVAGRTVVAAAGAQTPAPPAAPAPDAVSARALVDQYCVTCHNQRTKTGGLALDGLDVSRPSASADTWERAIRKLQARMMPPAGAPRPDHATLDGLVHWLETEIDRDAARSPNPGRPTAHRLNRLEYGNAIRDILRLDVEVADLLPADNAGYGFDNIADVLSSSPGLLERYMIAAQKISRQLVGKPDLRPSNETYRFPIYDPQEARPSDEFPAGGRGVSARHMFPADGQYRFEIRMHGAGTNIRGIDAITPVSTIDLRVDHERVQLLTIKRADKEITNVAGGKQNIGEVVDSNVFTLAAPIKAGLHTVSVILPESVWMTEGEGPSRLPPGSSAYSTNGSGRRGDIRVQTAVDHLRIEGPFDAQPEQGRSAAWRQLMKCTPRDRAEETACARTILLNVTRRAYRRPVTDKDVQPLLGFFRAGRDEGDFETGIQRALEAVLVDPEFLFRVEQAPSAAGRVYRIPDLDLASRLSFFLWSSVPDDELLNIAAQGRLRQPGVLRRQVVRMLKDDRADALLSNFFGQWLGIRAIGTVTPDRQAFPEFASDLRAAFQEETRLFLRAQVHEDRSVLDLLTANYSYLNERLARFYGVPNVLGSHFRRVTFQDTRRAGLLGQGSILTTTSYANRTSPVLRGKWVLEALLGTPPPPPPPNVPPFDASAPKDGERLSVRQQMERHRRNPACSSCHSMLDPLGFAFENFDGIGQWRDREHGVAVDASGIFPDGTKFGGPAEFRNILMQRRDAFLRTVTEKLLTYALGRGVEPYDMPAVRGITRAAAQSDYRWSSLIEAIVESLPFQMKAASAD
jgi:mono/diheme cytochrome c family protein